MEKEIMNCRNEAFGTLEGYLQFQRNCNLNERLRDNRSSEVSHLPFRFLPHCHE